MTKVRKTVVTFLMGLVMSIALCFGVVLSLPTPVSTAEAATTYTTKDVAMMGSVAGWYGNGNFEIRLTLGECDWAGESGQKDFAGEGDLPGLLTKLDFFNHIQVGGKTLAEWGCTTCYSNYYWLNQSEPKYTLTIPLAMGSANMSAATAAGVGTNSRLTILEGALIPSYAYLQGDTTATIYRAGCTFVTESSDVAYGVLAYGKTEVESIKYATGWDATYNNAYLGVSLKGDDFLGDGTVVERHPDYYSSVYTTNQFPNKITVDGESGKAESYGLFNHGLSGYYSFVFRASEADSESITIPAGTLFPSRAMRTLFDGFGNPVYIMYQTQTDVTFYKQTDGTWQKPLTEIQTNLTNIKVVADASNANDQFLLFTPANSDYNNAGNTYFGTSVTGADFIKSTNFYSHVLVDDAPIATSGEGIINVWSNYGTFAVRPGKTDATKITVLAGCQFPTYNALATGAREVYVTTEEITFVKNTNGVWEKYIPEGDFDTAVTLVQFGRAANVLNINLSVNDYPAPNGNDASTYNIGIDAEKILSLNLFDKIVVDGYTLRSMYNNYGAASSSEPWMWINKFVGHNFAVQLPGEARTADKIVIRAGAQFPSLAYINQGVDMYYVTTEEATYVRVSDNVEANWVKQAKITFVTEDETVTLPYTMAKGIEGEIPAVPEKAGYKGVWESYTLNGDDIVVNAVYTAHGFTEIETNLSKMEYKDGFLVVFLTNHDYAGAGYTLDVKDKLANLHFFNYLEVDGKMATAAPQASSGAFLNVWGGYEGAFATYLPCAAPTQKVVLKKGCQIPSNAYRLDENNKTCYVLIEDVTFLNENGTWVRQSSGEGGGSVSMKPEYKNDYVLSDLYHTSHSVSKELEKGYLLVDKTTDGTVYGYNASHSFSLTFDFSLNIGGNDLSAQGDYTIFDISMATRGYSSSHGFGWSFYLYRPGSAEKCVQTHCANFGDADGNLIAYAQAGIFEKGVTYRVTLGYKLVNQDTGTVETYINIDGWEIKDTYVLGADYINFARNVDSIAFSTTSAIGNGVRISDPGLTAGEENHKLTISDGENVLSTWNANTYVLPALDPVEYDKTGKVLAGWTTDINTIPDLYPVGYEYVLVGDTTFYPVWIDFAMQDGAAVRTAEGSSGIRFLVDVANNYGLLEAYVMNAGTLVVPTNYLKNGTQFMHSSFSAGYYVDVLTDSFRFQDSNEEIWTYTAALINISADQYARKFSARGYILVEYTTGEGYIYTPYVEELHSRSIYEVAKAAYADKYSGYVEVQNYVNSVADITIDSSFNATKNGEQGNYNVTASVDGNTVTVTIDKRVKAVVINDTRVVMGYSANVLIGGVNYAISGYTLASSGTTFTFEVEQASDTVNKKYYLSMLQSYIDRTDYTATHEAFVDSTAQTAMDVINSSNDTSVWERTYSDAYATLQRVKTAKELADNVGATLATPTVSYGLGYTVTWGAVDNADYYLVTDDNDYRDGVIVLATEALSYKTEVVGKHNVTVTAYSYYDEYATSATSASFAAVEVKPVFSYKALTSGLYKFSESQMKTMGIGDNLNTENDGTSYRYDKEAEKYFAYYNKYTGWSKNEGYATDWTSPAEFPAHAARLKAMGNNVLLIAEDTAASFKTDGVWETSRTKYVMDTAWTLGMKVIVCDEAFYRLSRTVGSQSEAANVIANRQGFTDYVTHPAFYGFSLADEPERGEVENVGYMVKALKAACANLGYSKANGNEPFFLACLYQKNVGFSTIWNYDSYLESWIAETGLDYLYVDLYTGHAMGDTTNRYETTFEAVYKSGLGVIEGNVKFHQAITAHTQNKVTTGKLLDQDLYMSMLYAAAHNVAGYSWFCYFPIAEETAGSMVGFDGNGYGNGIGNSATLGYSYYNAAKTAGYQFELIQGVLNGYQLKSRSYRSNLLTTTLSNGSSTATMYVNADTQNVNANVTVTASGSVCYLVGYGVGTAEAPYDVVSGSITLQPGQAVICMS